MTFRSLIDRVATGWLLLWLSFFAVYIHMGGLAFAGLVILLGAVGWVVWLTQRQDYPALTRPGLVCLSAFLIFFLWLGASGLWSGAGPETAIRLAGQMALLSSIPILLRTRTEQTRDTLSHILMAMSLGGVAVLALDVASGYGINTLLDPIGPGESLNKRQGEAEMNIGRGHVVYALLTPLLIALFATRLSRGRAIAATLGFVAVLLIGTLLNRLAVAPVVLIGAAPLFWVGFRSPRWGLRLSLGAACASILLAPLVGVLSRLMGEGVMASLPMSWDHRLRMWDYSLARISEAPLIGKGLDSSRNMQDAFTTRIGVDVPFVSLHPHNLGLQTWMEAGALGAVLLTVALLTLYRPLRRLIGADSWRSAAVSGTLMSATIASAVTVGAWQYWWWGLVGLGLTLAALIPSQHGLNTNRLTD